MGGPGKAVSVWNWIHCIIKLLVADTQCCCSQVYTILNIYLKSYGEPPQWTICL